MENAIIQLCAVNLLSNLVGNLVGNCFGSQGGDFLLIIVGLSDTRNKPDTYLWHKFDVLVSELEGNGLHNGANDQIDQVIGNLKLEPDKNMFWTTKDSPSIGECASESKLEWPPHTMHESKRRQSPCQLLFGWIPKIIFCQSLNHQTGSTASSCSSAAVNPACRLTPFAISTLNRTKSQFSRQNLEFFACDSLSLY